MRNKGYRLIALLMFLTIVLLSTNSVYASDEGEADTVIVEELSEDGAEQTEIQIEEETLLPDEESLIEEDSEDTCEENTETETEEANPNEEMESAFNELAAQKDIMAVINLIDFCPVYPSADTSDVVSTYIPLGNTVFVREVKIIDGIFLYRIEYENETGVVNGYVESAYLAYSDEDWIEWLCEYGFSEDEGDFSLSSDGYDDVKQFPAGYQAALNSLKSKHKNWTFVPLNTGLDFNEAVSNEMGDKSWIYINTSNSDKGYIGNRTKQTNWAYATRKGVEYYMDPRNFLTESYVFQFEQLTYNKSYHTVEAIQSFLNGTFMNGVLPDNTSMTYAKAFYNIGSSQGVSPIHLASRVYQEQGKGTSPLISGTYSGYTGYYNYFNVGATGSTESDVIKNGLAYAKNAGWNTRYKSLEGGAKTIGNGYIKKGQDTSYLQKFNVNPGAVNAVYTHQYMQNIQAPASESTTTKNMYEKVGAINSPFVFKIPVFLNMPGFKLNKSSVKMNVGDTYTLVGSINGTNVSAEKITWKANSDIVSISSTGTISAIKPGDATITATYDGNTYLCRITIKSPLKSLELNITEDVMRRPDTVVSDDSGLGAADKAANRDSSQLTVSYFPEDTTDVRECTFSSSNKKVATVDSKGLIKAVGAGTAVITAKAKANSKITVTCRVEVIAPIYKVELTDIATGEELLVGQSRTLSLEYWPKNTTSEVKPVWKSSDSSIADINNGKVCGIKEGNADISVELNGYSSKYAIKVSPCNVRIMTDSDDPTVWKTVSLPYDSNILDNLGDVSGFELKDDELFMGWYTQKDGNGKKITESMTVTQKEITIYPYYEPQGKGFYVVPVGDQVYTGSAVKPTVIVYDGLSYEEGFEEKELTLNKDYTVSYSNNKSVNSEGGKKPTITVKGKGNYSGKEKVYFNIIRKNINDPDIEVSDLVVTYTGKTIKSVPVIKRGSVKLTKDKDVKITYPQTGTGAYLSEGTYPITITGIGGYCGARTITETISPAVAISSSSVSVSKISKQLYTGTPIEPEIKLTYKKKTLVKSANGTDGDFTVLYSNNTNIGTATVVITAVDGSGFRGSRAVTFKIAGTSISKAKINGLQSKVYTTDSEAVKQNFVAEISEDGAYVTLGGNVLTPSYDGVSGDYTISYKNINKAGNATVTITGINAYSGSVSKKYKISPYNILNDVTTGMGRISMSYHLQNTPADEISITGLDEISCQYIKGGGVPVVTVYDTVSGQSRTLDKKDCSISFNNFGTVSYPEISKKKMPQIVIKGKGNYTGKITGYCTVNESDFADGKVKIVAGDVVYKASKGSYKATPVLTDSNGKKLKNKTDYKNVKYRYESFPEGVDTAYVDVLKSEPQIREVGEEVGANDLPCAGTVISVSAEGTKNYKDDTIYCTYRITKAKLNGAKVKIKAKSYNNGRAVVLEPEDIEYVKVGKAILTYGDDYLIDESSYVNNYNKGKANVTLIAKTDGNYGGSIKVSYSILSKTIALWRNLIN